MKILINLYIMKKKIQNVTINNFLIICPLILKFIEKNKNIDKKFYELMSIKVQSIEENITFFLLYSEYDDKIILSYYKSLLETINDFNDIINFFNEIN